MLCIRFKSGSGFTCTELTTLFKLAAARLQLTLQTQTFLVTSKRWGLTDIRTVTGEKPKKSTSTSMKTLLWIIFIPIIVVAVIICISAAVCYLKRRGCFSGSEDSLPVHLSQEDATQAKLIKNADLPDESRV